MTLFEKLSAIQNELKAPKGQYNNFGKYSYRSAEDILEAVKPICKKHKTVLVLSDEVKQIGERYYVEACATLHDLESVDALQVTAFAREEETKKGMDASQVTGATSSYARKYALNGLFNIDDTKDADTDEYHNQVTEGGKAETKAKAEKAKADDPKISHDKVEIAVGVIRNKQTTLANILQAYNVEKLADLTESQYKNMMGRLSNTPDKE
mgnify:CR=1 FL=1